MEQRRLLLAFLLSAIILFGWSYLFPPADPQPDANNAQPTPGVSPTPAPQAAQQPAPGTLTQPAEAAPDSVARRTVTVSTPLYEVEIDTQGAVARSWVIKRNKDEDGEGKPLYSISSTKDKPQPLQLVSPEGVARGLSPLRLFTGRPELDSVLSSRNYQVAGVEGNVPTPRMEVRAGERKSVDFTVADAANGLEVLKRLSFDADGYVVKVEVKLSQNGQPLPNARLLVGPNIGDQGVPGYTFYSVAPEGVAFVGDDVVRVHASEVDSGKESPGVRVLKGPAQWAAVGDTYFAMALVLPQPLQDVEYRTEKYQHQAGETKEDRFLISGYVPIPTDGSAAYLFTGPKDHDQLESISASISQHLGGRQVNLSGLIDYGWTRFVTKPLAAPILWSIKHLNRLTGSYGVAIILFTVIIYMLFFPLKWRSSKAMKKAQKLAPQMKELQEKIKGLKQNDPRLKELQKEQLRLMKEGNPLGGCLPLLIQMPFLIALYIAITISIDFRQSSFLWIQDLSAADPYHLLPILMAASMLVLQLITPAPSADPLQRKMMAIIMPVMMLYILWSAPAGLLVYWLVGNIVGFGQQVVINRLLKSEDDEEPQPPEKGKASAGPKKKLGEARVSQA
jgi:YidC/Oxa1 family membrane protein insertase